MPTPRQILKQTFGYTAFKPLQEEIIGQVLGGRDTLAIMPTGGGKSLCYQLPPLMSPGLTLVVSPLISLMKDQVEQLTALGIPACYLNSSLDFGTYQAHMEQVRSGAVRLLYLAPETLLTPRILGLLDGVRLDCLVIDEAHCISEWGHDFRPEYRQLAAIRPRYPHAVCLALTATATPRVRRDIQTSLGFAAGNEFVASFDRPNLLLEVRPKQRAEQQALAFVRRFPGQSGIVYCFSRRGVDSLAEFLVQAGISARPYHAGLGDEDRRMNQEAFIRDDVQLIVATVAFGMGINKPNVRFVLHFDIPKSMEGYYQEIGRAGRDGLPAHCLLLYREGDVVKVGRLLDSKAEPERSIARAHLERMQDYAEADDDCRRRPLLAHFGETYHQANCGACDNCRHPAPDRADLSIPAQKLLSCIRRTGERFGLAHVLDVLLGKRTPKVEQHGHAALSTFNIGSELNLSQWRFLARQLKAKGLMSSDGEFRILQVTEAGMRLLRERAPFFGRLGSVIRAEDQSPAAPGSADAALFELLRARRKALADAEGVPPYVIFSDRSLQEMAAQLPLHQLALSDIYGVGSIKLQRYGEAFLAVIQDYCRAKGIRPTDRPGPTPARAEARLQEMPQGRTREVAEAFNSGAGLDELSRQFAIKPTTVLHHLERWQQASQPLGPMHGLAASLRATPEQQRQALAIMAEVGIRRLTPVFERLQGAVSYEDLQVLRLIAATRDTGHRPA
jgi:ATP-dependent DNA helicase RecQ